jgi:hypothetical protein
VCCAVFFVAVCSVVRGGTPLIPRADLIKELKDEIISLRRSVQLTKMDAELHAVHVRRRHC